VNQYCWHQSILEYANSLDQFRDVSREQNDSLFLDRSNWQAQDKRPSQVDVGRAMHVVDGFAMAQVPKENPIH